MDETSAEKAKARRAILILYAAMAVGVALPVVLFLILHYR
jgi:hypothetical protein